MSWATRLVLLLLSAAFSILMGIQGLTRYVTYHNQTYDLALYARQAWGLAHGIFWDSIVDVHFLGSHIALVLWPLGLLGRVFGVVPVLLVAQVLAFGLTTLPLAQMAARRFGDVGALCAAALWIAYPNISHVASYEFHPGSLGVLPLALALDAIDQRRWLSFLLSAIALLLCRADFGLLVMMLALLATWTSFATRGQPGAVDNASRRLRAAAAAAGLLALAYLCLQYVWLRPRYGANHASYDLHFGPWGGSPAGIVSSLWREPGVVIGHFAAPERWSYLWRVLWPLGCLPLLAPRALLPALPYLAINLISTFPTTVELYSHYLTPAVPTLVAAAFEGLSQLRKRVRSPRLLPIALSGLLALVAVSSWRYGALPWSVTFPAAAFRMDARSGEAARVVALVPDGASVQAPDPLLPHLHARREVYRSPPPERPVDFVVLDVSHRARYAHRENLLRTVEEPVARAWLARRDFGLIHAEPSYLLFARGKDSRAGPAARFLSEDPSGQRGVALTRCMAVSSAWLQPEGLQLELSVQAPCPSDLALKILLPGRPERVDLLFDGLLSPARLRDEHVYSWHVLSPDERSVLRERGLSLALIRANGAPVEPADPRARAVPVVQ